MADTTLYQVRYRVKVPAGQAVNPWTNYGVPEPDFEELLTGLTPNTNYELQVVATNSVGSVTSPITPFSTVAVPPSAPGTPTASVITTVSMVLNWTASPSGTGTINYQVMQRLSGVGSYVAVGSPTTSLSAQVGNLTQNTAYDFQIVASNSGGSATSGTLTATTALAGIPPSAPSNLSAINVAQTSLVLLWVGSTGNPAPVYQVRYRVSGTTSFLPFGATTTTGSSNVTGLTAGTTYDFVVDAINSFGTTTSPTYNVTTLPATVAPTIPTPPVLTAIGQTSLTATWGTSTGSPTPQYQLQYRVGASGTFANYGAPIPGTTINVTGLTAGTLYNFQVQAINSAGVATSTISSATTTAAPVAPSQPQSLASPSQTSSSVTLTWVAPATGDTPFTYRVQSAPQGTGNWTDATNGLSALTFTVPSLLPSTFYDFRVFARNALTEGSPSTVLTVQTATAPATAPGATTGLAAGTITSSSVALTWVAPTTGTPPFTYHMMVAPHGGAFTEFGTTAALSGTITGLNPSTSYDFQVFASNGTLPNGANSNVVNVTTSGVLPSQVPGVTATGATSSTMLVTWQTPPGVAVTSYQVSYKTHAGATWISLPPWLESANGTIITPGSGQIVDKAGNTFVINAGGQIFITPPGGTSTLDPITNGVTQGKYWAHTFWQVNNLGNWYPYGGSPGSWAQDPAGDPQPRIAADTSFSETVTGLTTNTSYDFRVQAFNAVGGGPVSAVATNSTTNITGVGPFTVSNGAILDANNNPFVSRGIAVVDAQINAISAAQVVKFFPRCNLIRLSVGNSQHGFLTPAFNWTTIKAWIDAAVAIGLVVVVDDHEQNAGTAPYTGSQLTTDLNYAIQVATAYKNTPAVWLQSMNEPGTTSGLSTYHKAFYDAVRNTGNNNIILHDVAGGNLPNTPSDSQTPYQSMVNTGWDAHFYNWMTGGNTNQQQVNDYLNSHIQTLQAWTKMANTSGNNNTTPAVWMGECGFLDYANNYQINVHGANGTKEIVIASLVTNRSNGGQSSGSATWLLDGNDPYGWGVNSDLLGSNSSGVKYSQVTEYGVIWNNNA